MQDSHPYRVKMPLVLCFDTSGDGKCLSIAKGSLASYRKVGICWKTEMLALNTDFWVLLV